MTWKELLGATADEWDKLSDEELTKILQPYFSVTRPELATKSEVFDKKVSRDTKKTGGPNQLSFDKLKQELMRQATQAGILLPQKK